jgi:transmembrane anterior posterior transformation protein 1
MSGYFSSPELDADEKRDSSLDDDKSYLGLPQTSVSVMSDSDPLFQTAREFTLGPRPVSFEDEAATWRPRSPRSSPKNSPRNSPKITSTFLPTESRSSFLQFFSREFSLVMTKTKRIRLSPFLVVPLKLELAAAIGIASCIDRVLFEFTIAPIKTIWLIFLKFPFFLLRKICFSRYRSTPLITSDEILLLIRLTTLIFCVSIFHEYVDFSVYYHYLRAQSLLKLYFLFNMLEIFERLVRSWGTDIEESLSASLTSSGAPDEQSSSILTSLGFVFYVIIHSAMHFCRLLLISVSLVSGDSSMFMIVVTNNFAEIKGTVFKKYDQKAMYGVFASDIVERVNLFFDVFFVLIGILTSPQTRRLPIQEVIWWCVVILTIEILTDWIKYPSLMKFNKIETSSFMDYNRTHCEDIVNSSTTSTLITQRMSFQSLPIAVLLVFLVFTPSIAGATSSVIWSYRLYVWLSCLFGKLTLGMIILAVSVKVVEAGNAVTTKSVISYRAV